MIKKLKNGTITDLIIVSFLAFIIFAILIFSSGILRIFFGTIYIFILPGYVMTAILFPRRGDIVIWERLVLILLISIAILIFIGLALNYFWGNIDLIPCLVTLLIFIEISIIITWYRRKAIEQENRFEPRVNLGTLKRLVKLHKVVSWRYLVLFILIISCILGSVSYFIVKSYTNNKFTEFYLLNNDQKTNYFQQDMSLGDTLNVYVGIDNKEHKSLNYSVEITLDGNNISSFNNIELNDNDKWQQSVDIIPDKTGLDQEVVFTLFKDSKSYRELRLWLNVK
jgi:uncharacterized membrane protein